MAIEVVLPMLGITVEKGTIIEWMKKEGDPVEKGEVIFVVEVEKATTEVESPASGILAKILVPIGVEVPILTVAAIITAPGEELPAEYAAPAPEAPVAEAPPAPEPTPSGIWAVPAAQRLAKEHRVDLTGITGTGPEGVITVKDVNTAMATTPKAPEVKVSTLAHRLAQKEGVDLTEIQGTGIRDRVMRADVKAYL